MRLDPASKSGDDHRHDQQQSDDDALDVGGHIRQPKGVAQDGQREERKDDARIVPRPPKMSTPPRSTMAITTSVRPMPTSAQALAMRAVNTRQRGDRA